MLALSIVFSVLALAGGAGAAQNPVERPPSLLWKSYPLKQRATVSLSSIPFALPQSLKAQARDPEAGSSSPRTW